jgi:hypothetical protein
VDEEGEEIQDDLDTITHATDTTESVSGESAPPRGLADADAVRREQETLHQRLALQYDTAAGRSTLCRDEPISKFQAAWIRMLAKLRAKDEWSAAPDPRPVSGEAEVVNDPEQPITLRWWRFPPWLRDSLRDGVDFTFEYAPRRSSLRNYKLEQKELAAAAEELSRLMALGYLSAPIAEDRVSEQALIINPIGCCAKKGTDKRRIFYDCKRSGLNKSMVPIPYNLPSVADGVELMSSPLHFGCKHDLKDGFYMRKVSPDSQRYLGVRIPPGVKVPAAVGEAWGPQWSHRRLPGGDFDASNLVVRGTVCLFGVKTSPVLFSQGVNPVTRLINKISGRTRQLLYVDDFLTTAKSRRQCAAWSIATRAIFAWLGLKEKTSKHEPPSQRLEWLGLVIDAAAGKVFIPEDKKAAVSAVLEKLRAVWRGKGAVPHDELESVVGTLGFLTAAVKGGNTFLRRFYDTLNAPKHKGFVRTPPGFWEDVEWWQQAIAAAEGRTFPRRFATGSKLIKTVSDASGVGWGCTRYMPDGSADRRSFAWQGEEGKRWSNWREAAAVVRMIEQYGHEWRGRRVVHATDNTTTKAMINKGSVDSQPGEQDIMNLARKLHYLLVKFDIDLLARHISGTSMQREGTDGLSRPKQARPRMKLKPSIAKALQAAFDHSNAEVVHSVEDLGAPDSRNIMLDVPWNQVDAAVDLLLAAKSRNPAFTSATLITPDWPSPPWRSALKYFDVVARFQPGSYLYEFADSGVPVAACSQGACVLRLRRACEKSNLSRRLRRSLLQAAATFSQPDVGSSRVRAATPKGSRRPSRGASNAASRRHGKVRWYAQVPDMTTNAVSTHSASPTTPSCSNRAVLKGRGWARTLFGPKTRCARFARSPSSPVTAHDRSRTPLPSRCYEGQRWTQRMEPARGAQRADTQATSPRSGRLKPAALRGLTKRSSLGCMSFRGGQTIQSSACTLSRHFLSTGHDTGHDRPTDGQTKAWAPRRSTESVRRLAPGARNTARHSIRASSPWWRTPSGVSKSASDTTSSRPSESNSTPSWTSRWKSTARWQLTGTSALTRTSSCFYACSASLGSSGYKTCDPWYGTRSATCSKTTAGSSGALTQQGHADATYTWTWRGPKPTSWRSRRTKDGSCCPHAHGAASPWEASCWTSASAKRPSWGHRHRETCPFWRPSSPSRKGSRQWLRRPHFAASSGRFAATRKRQGQRRWQSWTSRRSSNTTPSNAGACRASRTSPVWTSPPCMLTAGQPAGATVKEGQASCRSGTTTRKARRGVSHAACRSPEACDCRQPRRQLRNTRDKDWSGFSQHRHAETSRVVVPVEDNTTQFRETCIQSCRVGPDERYHLRLYGDGDGREE